jgi:G:T-mismatch repair DNA endonuclease (very short patch repair protein)
MKVKTWKKIYNYSKNNHCECGKLISNNAKKCEPCWCLFQRGKTHSRYKDGRYSKKHYCINCGKEISYKNWLYGSKRCMSCATKYRWNNPKFKNKMLTIFMLNRQLKPNKPEKFLIKLFKQLKLNFKYVGDGKRIIGGFCPDFIDEKNKKIIEFNGTYWHDLIERIKSDKRKLQKYGELGYKILILTEKDLKDIDKLKQKLIKFGEKV